MLGKTCFGTSFWGRSSPDESGMASSESAGRKLMSSVLNFSIVLMEVAAHAAAQRGDHHYRRTACHRSSSLVLASQAVIGMARTSLEDDHRRLGRPRRHGSTRRYTWCVRRFFASTLALLSLAACTKGTTASPTLATADQRRPNVAPTPASTPQGASADVGRASLNTPFTKGLDTPEAAAKNLWDAWRDDDRDRALVAADPAAVATLFLDPWGPEIDEQGCVGVVTGARYRCAFVQGSAARIIDVASVGGRYRVTRTERIGDFARSSGPLAANRPGPAGGPTVVAKARPSRAQVSPGSVPPTDPKSASTPTTPPKKTTKTRPVAVATPLSPTPDAPTPSSLPTPPSPVPVRAPAQPSDTAAG